MIELILGDCLEKMKLMKDKSIDLCLTDPPYGIGIAKNPFRGRFEKKQWDNFIPDEKYFNEIIRISKHQVIWGGNYFSKYLQNFDNFLIWDKKQSEDFSSAMAEIAYSSKRRPAKIFRKHAASFEKFHPTTKPVDLMSWCLSFFKNINTVVDPFMGSGTTGVSCIELGISFIGIEKDIDYFNIATKRIEKAKCKANNEFYKEDEKDLNLFDFVT